MYTPITTPEARDRAELATKTLLWIEIAFGALAFWSDALEARTWKHLLVAGLLTAGFGAISYLASTIVSRFSEANGHKLTRGLVTFAGVVLIIVAGGMTWHGLVWANDVAGLVPAGFEFVLPIAAYGLSALNVIGLYVFTREIRRKAAVVTLQPVENPRTIAGRNLARLRWDEQKRA